MQELIERFVRERVYFKNVSPRTQSWYQQSFHAFDGAIESRAAIGERIGQLRDRGVSATSVNTYLECINAFHRWANIEGHIAERIHIPKLKQEQKVLETLTPEHIQRIVSFRPQKVASERRVHTIACLLLDTGLRIDEALSLTRDDVNLDDRLLKVRGKGGKHRLVPISAEGRKVLWRWMAGRTESLVFSTRAGTKPVQRNLLRDFKRLGTKLQITGVRFSFHTMRHTFAVGYIRAGGDVFRLQRVLGHTTLEMTRRYVNLQTSDLQAVHDRLSVLGKGVA